VGGAGLVIADGEMQSEPPLQDGTRYENLAAGVHGFEEAAVFIVATFVTEIHHRKIHRGNAFKSGVGIHPGCEFAGQADVLADVRNQAFTAE
jgi:hypothetical protein